MPVAQKVFRAIDRFIVFLNEGVSRGFVVQSRTKRRETLGDTATRGFDHGFELRGFKRQSPTARETAKETGGNHAARVRGERVHVEADRAQGRFGDFTLDQRIFGAAIAGDHFLGCGKDAMGRSDQSGTVWGDEPAQDRASRFHQLRSDQNIEITGAWTKREDGLAVGLGGHFDVINRCPRALRDASDRRHLHGIITTRGEVGDPVGEHAAPLPADCEYGEFDDVAHDRSFEKTRRRASRRFCNLVMIFVRHSLSVRSILDGF